MILHSQIYLISANPTCITLPFTARGVMELGYDSAGTVLHVYLFITYRHSECRLNPTYRPFKLYSCTTDVLCRNLNKYEVRIFKKVGCAQS